MTKSDDDYEKTTTSRRRLRLKKQTRSVTAKQINRPLNVSHVKARIDTGLKKKSESNSSGKGKRLVKTYVKKKMLPLPELTTLKDLIKLGKRIKQGQRFVRIDNDSLKRCCDHLQELDDLIGLEMLKSTVFDQLVYFLQKLDKITNNEYLHTMLAGPPGVGKTTVARILGKIYACLGVIENPKSIFKIAHREDLVASYLGQTATKTLALLKSCLGGVLFIDEVYSLGSGKEGKDSFSKEAVDTLCGFLSENAGKFICIIAGYEKDIERCFFNLNKGLKSRFQWVHVLEPYSGTQLNKIFLSQINDIGWTVEEKDKREIENVFQDETLFENGQGRAIKNFLFKCKIAHSKRLLREQNKKNGCLSIQDIQDAVKSRANTHDESTHNFQSMFL